MPKAPTKAPAKPPSAPPCDACRPYAEALGVVTGIAEWLLENAKRQMVPDIFTIGVMEGRLRAAVAGVGRGAKAGKGHQSGPAAGARTIDPGASNGRAAKPTL
jgi:hypothetical protein